MKKILSLVLTIAMVLTTMSVGFVASAAVAAEHQNSIAGYTATSTLPTTAGKYFLTQNVTVSSAYTFPAGVELNGNGYTISYTGGGANAFTFGGNATISNVSFGTSSAKISVAESLFKPAADGYVIRMTDVDFYVNNTTTSGGVNTAGFMTNTQGDHYFVRCNMYVTINAAAATWQAGGYFAQTNANGAAMLSFEDCTLNGSIAKNGQSGGFVSQLSGPATFINCTNNASVTSPAAGYFGAFVSTNSGTASITISGCRNTGAITTTGAATAVSGFVAHANSSVTLNITNSTNSGTITTNSSASYVGGIVGHVNAASLANFSGNTNSGAISFNSYTTAGNAGVGGIIGYGNLIAGSTIENCTNTGEITATYTTALASGQSHPVMGGIIGRAAGKSAIVRNSQNKGTVIGRGDVGGILAEAGLDDSITFEACVNAGTVKSETDGMKVGGILGDLSVAIPATFINCINGETGNVGSGKTNISGGILGQSWTGGGGTATFTRCQNLGTVHTSGAPVGGMLGELNGGGSAGLAYTYTFNDCVNAGTVTGEGSANPGGFIGQIGQKDKSTAGNYVIAFNNCVNKANISGSYAVGGFIGVGDGTITFNNSVNAGNIQAGERAGGFIGKLQTDKANADAANTVISLNNAVNIGTITAGTKAANLWGYYQGASGQFLGNTQDGYTPTEDTNSDGNIDTKDALTDYTTYKYASVAAVQATNAYAFGSLVMTANPKTPANTALSEAYNKGTMGSTLSYAAGASVKLIGSGAASGGYSYMTLDSAVAALNANSGFGYIFKVEGGKIVLGPEKAIARGYQISTDETAFRVLATINSLDYASVGFNYTVYADGEELVSGTKNTTLVYGSINANVNGIVKSISAEEVGGKYIYALTFLNIPDSYDLLEIIVSTVVNDGTTTYEGPQYVATFENGVMIEFVPVA